MSKNIFVFSLSIIFSTLILGGVFYAVQINKQQSIERQQEKELEQEQRLAEEIKSREDREYIAKRKSECYDIFLSEKKEWNNVEDFNYSELRDVCEIKYAATEPPRNIEECQKIWNETDDISGAAKDLLWSHFTDCKNNYFTKRF